MKGFNFRALKEGEIGMRRWAIWLVAVLVLFAVLPAEAQDSARVAARVAFVNGSGQLVVSSSDGSFRWIITNPGELLVDPVGYTWSADGNRVFFAVDLGAEVSLRVADIAAQSISELGKVPNNGLSGGQWIGSGVVIANGDRMSYIDTDNGAVTDLISGQGNIGLLSPYANGDPNLAPTSSVSPAGDYVFYQQGDGRYAVASLSSGTAFPLPGVNEPNARLNGLWSDITSLVAYWGFEGNSILSVTDAANGTTVTLDSGRTTPINPIAWREGTSQLLYRDGAGVVRLADVSCLFSGCTSNPLESGVEVLPASAMDVLVDGDWVFYREGDAVFALSLGCADSGTCAGSAAQLGGGPAPGTMIHAAGGTLAYTAGDSYSREVRIVPLDCLSSGGCSPQTALTGAAAGLVSPDGASVVVDQTGVGLNVLNLSSGTTTYLSDGGALATARWN